MTTLAFVLAAMTLLAPDRDHAELGEAIARVVDASPPLFGDVDRRKTAGLVVAIAYRESLFNNAARSKTNDWCAMGIHARPDLANDVDACVRTGLAMLRESVRACGAANVIGLYAVGNCSSDLGKRFSRDRSAIAAWLVRRLP